MKKYLLFILILLIIPFSVYADNCDDSKVIIKDITLKQSIGNTEELEPATLESSKINLNVKMYEVGDSIEYTFKVKNSSDEDYFIDDKIVLNHIEYKVSAKDGSNKVEIGEEKEFVLVATLNEELTKDDFKGGKFDASTNLNLSVTPASLYNPLTGNFFFRILCILLVIICIILFTNSKKIRIASLVLTIILIPYTSHAACKINLELNSNIVVGYVVPNPCVYDGNLVQGAELVNGQYTYRYKQQNGTNSWENINDDGWGVKLTNPSSTEPVTTTLCTSINNKPIVSMKYMFSNSQTTSIDTSSFDTSHVVSMSTMFTSIPNLTELDVSQFDTSKVTNMEDMFLYLPGLTSLDLSNFDTSHVTSMGAMVSSNSNLRSVNLDNFVILSIENAGSFLSGDSSLKSISAKNWVLPENAYHMFFRYFSGSSSIEEIDVTGWDLSHSRTLAGAFANGSGLKRIIGIDTWDTSNITDMSYMFYYDSSLTSLDLSTFDTYNVTNMSYMFEGCNNITEIDVSSFDTYKVTDMTHMFYNLGNLRTIYGSVWFNASNASSSSNMFYGCYNLVGGQGSPYNSLYIDRLSARLDEPSEGRPGYFTAKATS